jgi:hypothetical protein
MNWKYSGTKGPWPKTILFQHFPEGTEKKTENLSQDIRCPRQDSNQEPTKYKFKALPLYQPVRFTIHRILQNDRKKY